MIMLYEVIERVTWDKQWSHMSMSQPSQAVETSNLQCSKSCLICAETPRELESEQMNRTALPIPFAFELEEEARQRTSLLRAATWLESLRTKKPHSHLALQEVC